MSLRVRKQISSRIFDIFEISSLLNEAERIDEEKQRERKTLTKSLVIDTESLVRVLDKLVDGKGSVVRFDNSV